jgi:hypothetical protein
MKDTGTARRESLQVAAVKRLVDDPKQPLQLRGDLDRASQAGQRYDTDAKLSQLREVLEREAQWGRRLLAARTGGAHAVSRRALAFCRTRKRSR